MKAIVLDNIGSFTFMEALYSLEYPIVFTCRKEDGSSYLFYECESDEKLERWIACPLQNDDFYSLKTNQYSLRRAFLLHEHSSLTIEHDLLNDSYRVVRQMSIAPDDLPHEKFFIGHDGADETFAKDLFHVPLFEDKPCIAFRINPYSTQHAIGLKEDIALLSGVSQSIEAMGGNSADYNVLHSPGSTVISVFPKDGVLSAKGDAPEIVFQRARDVFAADNIDEMIRLSQDNLSAISKIKKVFNSIQKVGNGVEIYTKNANGEIKASAIRSSKVDDLCHEFHESAINAPVIDTYTGVLKGYNVKRRNFTFETQNGVIIEGKLDKVFSEEKQYPIPSEATIRVERLDKTTKSTNKSYFTLKEILPVEG